MIKIFKKKIYNVLMKYNKIKILLKIKKLYNRFSNKMNKINKINWSSLSYLEDKFCIEFCLQL